MTDEPQPETQPTEQPETKPLTEIPTDTKPYDPRESS